MKEGYHFIGNDDYLQISFWRGRDWKARIHTIGFFITKNGNCSLFLSAKDSEDKASFLKLIATELGGFKQIKGKNEWKKEYQGNNYIKNLEKFIKEEKPIIDLLIKTHLPSGIDFLDSAFDEQYVQRIIKSRK